MLEDDDEQIVFAQPTEGQMVAYMGAFNYFNAALFEGKLPYCFLNFSRRSKA